MKPFVFTAEEVNLMCIFDTSDRSKLIAELLESRRDVYEPDMQAVYGATLKKLASMSDADFHEIGLFPADEFDHEEG